MEGKRKYEKELAGVSDFPVKEYSVKKEKALRDWNKRNLCSKTVSTKW